MNIAVVALGKIGLPLAVQFAMKGHQVLGTDIKDEVVQQVNKAIQPFPGEPHLGEYLKQVIDSRKLTATTDTTDAVRKSDYIVVVVPLFVEKSGEPDFTWMDEATKAIGKGLKPGVLVSYETTLPVGTTRTRFAPVLEAISGLEAGRDFHLVFSPERVSTGRVFSDLRKYPKLVGGLNKTSSERGVKFYREVLDFDFRPDLPVENGVWELENCEAAEFAKLAETTYRDVNIALANQFAIYAESNGINIGEVIDASNSQPFSHIHQPGIAVGGHCIPIYPQFYLWNDPTATLVRTAREINNSMPTYVVKTLSRLHGGLMGQRVAVFGVAYRGGVKESAFSGIFPTVEELRKLGAIVFVHDPLYTDLELSSLGFAPYHYGDNIDAGLVHTDHREYYELTSNQLPGIRTFLDGRGVSNKANWQHVRYHVLGNSSSFFPLHSNP